MALAHLCQNVTKLLRSYSLSGRIDRRVSVVELITGDSQCLADCGVDTVHYILCQINARPRRQYSVDDEILNEFLSALKQGKLKRKVL
jgi:hypothetical protein